MQSEPLTDEQIAAIRRYLEQKQNEVGDIDAVLAEPKPDTAEIGRIRTVFFAMQLLAEVERLRAVLAEYDKGE